MRQQARCAGQTRSANNPTRHTSDSARPPAAVAACLAEIGDDSVASRGSSGKELIRAFIGQAAARCTLRSRNASTRPRRAQRRIRRAREFAALQRIAASTTAKGHVALAPAPLALCPEHGSYAMSWVDGRSITEALLAASCDFASAVQLGLDAGTWLREFHALRALPHRCSDFAAKIPHICRILATRKDDALVRRTAEVLCANCYSSRSDRAPCELDPRGHEDRQSADRRESRRRS